MRSRRIIETRITLADMHMDGVYFDPQILAALKAQRSKLSAKPFGERLN